LTGPRGGLIIGLPKTSFGRGSIFPEDRSLEGGGVTSKRTLAILTLVAAVVFLLITTGCVTKKRYKTLEQQSTEQLAQANAKINDLRQKGEALDKSLKDAQASLTAAQDQNKQLTANVASLKDQIAALESQKAELDKAVAAGKETEESYKKKVGGLNYAIGNLKKKAADMEAAIAAKDGEITGLQKNVADLKAQGEDQVKRIAVLDTDKGDLTTKLNDTIASKKSTTLILGILLALAVILAIVGFLRKKSPAA